MNVVVHAGESVVDFVGQHGGCLFVWVGAVACCGGTRFIEASTQEAEDVGGFVPVPARGASSSSW